MARDRRLALVRPLLAVNGVACLAAGIVLIARPAAIPALAGIAIGPGQTFLCYLLAACEFGLASLAWMAWPARSPESLRMVLIAFLVVHLVSAIAGIVAGRDNAVIMANAAARVVLVGLLIIALVALPREAQRPTP